MFPENYDFIAAKSSSKGIGLTIKCFYEMSITGLAKEIWRIKKNKAK